MQRAPKVNMTERQFRRMKRRQFQEVYSNLKELSEYSNLMPTPTSRRINSALKAIENARDDLTSWWRQY